MAAENNLIDEFPHLSQAASEEAWEYLNNEYPVIARAVQREVKAGKTAAEIGRAMGIITQRPGITIRCQLAAAYLAGNGDEDLPARMRAQ